MRRRDNPIPIDAQGGDWIKGDRVRVDDDGALYVPDPTAPSGTRRIEPEAEPEVESVEEQPP